jgi:hypothetical protein
MSFEGGDSKSDDFGVSMTYSHSERDSFGNVPILIFGTVGIIDFYGVIEHGGEEAVFVNKISTDGAPCATTVKKSFCWYYFKGGGVLEGDLEGDLISSL